MGPRRAVVGRAVLGIGLLVGSACGAAGPVHPVAVRPPARSPSMAHTPDTTPSTIDPAPPAGLPGEGGGGGGSRVIRAAPGGPAVTGRIEIPKIGLDHITYEGNSLAQIDHGPSHWPGTPMPGHAGNTVFPGHRITHTHPFFDIDQLAPGDQIIFTTAEGRFVYQVYESRIVRPSDMWVVENTPDAIATIFGCHPRGSARFRYMVRGRLVGTPLAARSAPAPAPARPQPPPTTTPPTTQPPPPPTTAAPRKPGCIICL
jgi:sortase A